MSTRSRTSASHYSQAWTPEATFCSSGLGVEVEGVIDEVRFVTVNAKDKVERYIALVLQVTLAYAVEHDKYGAEVSYDPAKHASRVLTADALYALVTPPEGLLDTPELQRIHPARPGYLEFWALASTDARHLTAQQAVHIKTQGNSFFVKSFFMTKYGSFQGLTGGAVMQEMSNVASTFNAAKPLPQDEMDGCASDEWADDD